MNTLALSAEQDDHNAKTLQRVGFRRMVDQDGKPSKSDAEQQRECGECMAPTDGECVSVEHFVLAEVCQGFDCKAVARFLMEHVALLPGAGRSFDCKQRLPGMGLPNCHRIRPALFAIELQPVVPAWLGLCTRLHDLPPGVSVQPSHLPN